MNLSIYPSNATQPKRSDRGQTSLKKILIITFNTLLLFVLSAEIYTRYQIYHYDHSQDKASAYLQRVLLYRDVNHFMDKRNHDDLNSDNIRYQHEASDIQAKDTNVLFLGDSFVYGFLLSLRAAIPYQFEEIAQPQFPDRKINGINFGWVSASPYLELNLLKRLGKKYQPDVVILDLDLGDFYDDPFYETVAERKSIYRFASYVPFSTFVIENIVAQFSYSRYESIMGFPKSQLYVNERPISESLPYINRYTLKNLNAINDYTKNELHAKFIVFVNPKTFHYNEKESPHNWMKDIVKRTPYSFEIFDYVDELSKESSYPVVSLLPVFQKTTVFPTAFDQDAHWNRDGYKIAATEMVEQCKRLGCFEIPLAPPLKKGEDAP